MKLQINRIIEAKPPYQPSGKTYKMYSWIIAGVVDGTINEGVHEVKAFKHLNLIQGMILEVEAQNYMGSVTYKIISIQQENKPKTSNNSSTATENRKNGYTLAEYNNLFCYAWDMFEPKLQKIVDPYHRYECLQKLISTFIISAVQNGIKAPEYNSCGYETHEQHQKLLNTQQGVA